MYVKLGWVAIYLVPSRDLAWGGGCGWVGADAPQVGWRSRWVGGLKLVVSGSVGELKLGVDGVGGSESVVGGSVVGLVVGVVGVLRWVGSLRKARW